MTTDQGETMTTNYGISATKCSRTQKWAGHVYEVSEVSHWTPYVTSTDGHRTRREAKAAAAVIVAELMAEQVTL